MSFLSHKGIIYLAGCSVHYIYVCLERTVCGARVRVRGRVRLESGFSFRFSGNGYVCVCVCVCVCVVCCGVCVCVMFLRSQVCVQGEYWVVFLFAHRSCDGWFFLIINPSDYICFVLSSG